MYQHVNFKQNSLLLVLTAEYSRRCTEQNLNVHADMLFAHNFRSVNSASCVGKNRVAES